MKILIYNEDYQTVKESGVGKAIEHQKRALDLVGVSYTLNPDDDYDICHINTVFPKSAFLQIRRENLAKKLSIMDIPPKKILKILLSYQMNLHHFSKNGLYIATKKEIWF